MLAILIRTFQQEFYAKSVSFICECKYSVIAGRHLISALCSQLPSKVFHFRTNNNCIMMFMNIKYKCISSAACLRTPFALKLYRYIVKTYIMILVKCRLTSNMNSFKYGCFTQSEITYLMCSVGKYDKYFRVKQLKKK